MSRKYLIISFLFIIFGLQKIAAQDTLVAKWTQERPDLRGIGADPLQFFYLLGPATVEKYDHKGALLASFRENGLGQITYVDASNPFQVLVFFEGQGWVVLLDRTLSELRRFRLVDLEGGLFAQAIGASSDNMIWIYDTEAFVLRKLDRQGQSLRHSVELSLALADIEFSPQRVYEYKNRVFLHDRAKGVAVFDNFANLQEFLPIGEAGELHFFSDLLLYMHGEELHGYDFEKKIYSKQEILGVRPEEYDDLIISIHGILAKKGEKAQFFGLK